MVAYAFYWFDEKDRAHLVGLLPERRRNPERVTQESILNFLSTILGKEADVNNISFIQVTLDESTGKIYWNLTFSCR